MLLRNVHGTARGITVALGLHKWIQEYSCRKVADPETVGVGLQASVPPT